MGTSVLHEGFGCAQVDAEMGHEPFQQILTGKAEQEEKGQHTAWPSV